MNLTAMNPTIALRQINLVRLVAESGGNASTAARRAGKDRRQFSAWSTGRKAISDESARDIERAFGKPAGWMDREHASPSRPVYVEPRIESHPQRLDPTKMRDAMTLLRHLAELRDVPELVSDPVALAIAFDVVVEFDTPLTNENVLDLTKRLAAKLKGGGNATSEGDAAA
jgi:hypothetical protein